MKDRERIEAAIKLGFRYGGNDGAHHKMWVIDQMIRLLAGDRYRRLVRDSCNGENGPDTYEWDTGSPP